MCWQGYGETGIFVHCLWECKWHSQLENSIVVLQKIKCSITMWSSNSALSTYTKELKARSQKSQSSYSEQQNHSNQKVEATQSPLMDERKAECGLLFSLTTTTGTNLEDIVLSDISQSPGNSVWFHTYEVLRVVESIETENRRWIASH